MGKRSAFPKIPKDQYMTIDKRAVARLLPFLSPNSTFAEPCVGTGMLMSDLELAGHKCNWFTDIEPQFSGCLKMDALDMFPQMVAHCDEIITNPPWSRPILHKLIRHFVTLKPTWLLFDSDWMHTQQSAELMREYCTDIVSVGRLKWIPNTNVSGKDNCQWYRFSKTKGPELPTFFHGR